MASQEENSMVLEILSLETKSGAEKSCLDGNIQNAAMG
jgi:hypothetical protein